MPQSKSTAASTGSDRKSKGPSSLTVTRVFIEWSLQREAPRWPPSFFRLAALLPVLLTGVLAVITWPWFRRIGTGASAMCELLSACLLFMIVGGMQFASRAACWEMSVEMRDIIRLTSINPKVMLWTTALCRWWTIGWSLLLLLPLFMLAISFGGVTRGQVTSGGCGLLLTWALTCGFGMLASVLTANTKNPEKSTTSMTAVGLILYNALFPLVSQSIHMAYWLMDPYEPPLVTQLCRSIAYFAPAVGVWASLVTPTLFTVSEPGYWMHFFPACVSAVMATLLVEQRLGSNIDVDIARPTALPWWFWLAVKQSEASEEVIEFVHADVPGDRVQSRRPRCSERPFFWKDVYILGGERGWFSLWSMAYMAATFGVLILNFLSQDDHDRIVPAVIAVISIVVTPCIVSVRFDSLLTAEFRDRTWGSLMLLPVDPCHLLREKFRASLWEQRFILLPVGTAILAALVLGRPEAIMIVGMASVMAPLGGIFLCQMSCINQLLGKVWWLGPCQAFAFVGIIILVVAIWSCFGPWPGFFMSAFFLFVVVCGIQSSCVDDLARKWVEV